MSISLAHGSTRKARAWLGALAVALGGVALASPESVDRIVAIVNDDVVLASEVVERYEGAMQRLREEGQPDLIPTEALIEQIVERLILESIQLQEAETRGVVVDDETLTRAVTDYASQSGMSIDEFIAALDGEGLSYRGFRDTVRRQLTLDRVQREVVNRRVYITEQDLTELLASPFFAEQLSDEYRLGHILLPVASGATQSQMDAVRLQAEALVAELRGGADFAAAAVEHSSASTALEGGDLGWRRANRLPSLFAEAAIEESPGTVLDPMQNASGFHVVKLLDRRGASQQTANETLLRHILVEPSAILTDADAKALVSELRGRIEAGEDFGDLAMEFSDDPVRRSPGATSAGRRAMSSCRSSARPWRQRQPERCRNRFNPSSVGTCSRSSIGASRTPARRRDGTTRRASSMPNASTSAWRSG